MKGGNPGCATTSPLINQLTNHQLTDQQVNAYQLTTHQLTTHHPISSAHGSGFAFNLVTPLHSMLRLVRVWQPLEPGP